MKARPTSLPARLPHALLAAVLAGACAGAMAQGLERAGQGGRIVAGVAYPVPEYRGGMKFRTPESLDSVLLADLAKRLGASLATVRIDPAQTAAQLSARKADLAVLAVGTAPSPAMAVVPTGYTAAPMAVMRSDTDIKRWEHLKGRKVCLSEGGLYKGTLSATYGAIEILQRAPADSLLAVRTGACDAAVHDSAMLEELIRLPEWKKFSARLPAGPAMQLAFVLPATDAAGVALLRRTAAQWKSSGFLDQAMKTAVRHIAFEVYLDQDVPDCH